MKVFSFLSSTISSVILSQTDPSLEDLSFDDLFITSYDVLSSTPETTPAVILSHTVCQSESIAIPNPVHDKRGLRGQIRKFAFLQTGVTGIAASEREPFSSFGQRPDELSFSPRIIRPLVKGRPSALGTFC